MVGHAVLGGPRSSAYVRAIEGPMASVGAELAPGAVAALFGVPARLLAERHTVLEDLWGGAVIELRERLRAEIDGSARLALFEAFLEARLPRVRGVHPAIAEAVARLAEGARVADVVTKSGASHRRFVDRFRDVVGLGPKSFARVARLQRAVGLLGRGNPLVDVAADAGYADQPHLCRDFAEIAGVSPAAYARACPEGGNHVPIRRSA